MPLVAATLLAPVLLLLSAAGGGPPAGNAPADSTAKAPVAPASTPAPGAAAGADEGARPERTDRADLDAQAAVRATQDLEAKMIEIRRELDGLQKQRAAWEDIRRGLDELTPRVDELARRGDQPPLGQPPSSPGPFAERGMFFRTADGSSSLRPQVRLQAGFEGILVDRAPGQTVAPDIVDFQVRHAELMFEGSVFFRRFEYRLLVDFAESRIMKDAFLQWRQSAWLAVRVGQFKLPFGFQRYLRSTYYDFVDLSETMAAFSLERDVGVMALGRPLGGRLQYQLAISNGAGAGQPNDNRDLAYTARVVAAPWGPLPDSEGDLVGQRRPLLAVGAAGYFNLLPTDVVVRTNNPQANTDVDANGVIDTVAVWQGGIELRAHFRGAALQAEIFRRLEHPGAAAADRRTGGFYVQASYFVIPHFLSVAARLESTDLPLYGVSLAERQARGSHLDGQTAAVNAFLRGHDLKLQLDYSHLRIEDVAVAGGTGTYSPDSHRLRASAQLMF